MKVYEFGYNSCIHESAMACMSLHKTKKGAEIAMEHHKNQARKEFAEREKYWKENNEDWGFEFGEHEAWAVYERDVVE